MLLSVPKYVEWLIREAGIHRATAYRHIKAGKINGKVKEIGGVKFIEVDGKK